jgi:hypothetical protein
VNFYHFCNEQAVLSTLYWHIGNKINEFFSPINFMTVTELLSRRLTSQQQSKQNLPTRASGIISLRDAGTGFSMAKWVYPANPVTKNRV